MYVLPPTSVLRTVTVLPVRLAIVAFILKYRYVPLGSALPFESHLYVCVYNVGKVYCLTVLATALEVVEFPKLSVMTTLKLYEPAEFADGYV